MSNNIRTRCGFRPAASLRIICSRRRTCQRSRIGRWIDAPLPTRRFVPLLRKQTRRVSDMKPLALLVFAAVAAFALPPAATAQTSPEQIYAELAKVPAGERQKRLEEGARREGKLILVHTMRGNLSVDHVALFKKRFPFLTVELEGDIGSQDAAERLYAEETAGRHLTDVINIALPDITPLIARNMVARYPTPMVSALLPPYR